MPCGFHSFIPENEQLEDDSENKLTFFPVLSTATPFFGVKKTPGGGLKHLLVVPQPGKIFFSDGLVRHHLKTKVHLWFRIDPD